MKYFLSSLAIAAASLAPALAHLEFIPNSYIIEFDVEKAQAAKVPEAKLQIKLENFLSDAHSTFHDHMRKRCVDYEIRQQFHEPKLFSGVSVKLASNATVNELRNAPNVKAVYRTRAIPNPSVGMEVQSIDAKNKVAVDAAQTDTFSTHVMTGVDKLHDQGYYGKGIKIGIIDTGVDYKNPALGGCFGPGCLVSYGYDFVGNDYDGTNEPQPDSDPYSNCEAHGTHVAGIVAANSTLLGFTGVAPQATIGMYRVFGCEGSAGDDVIMAAMMQAVQDGSDVISMSLGEAGGWMEGPLAVVASRVVKETKSMIVAAQGNDGAVGAFYSSSPANGAGVISVASVDNSKYTVYTAKTAGAYTKPVQYYAGLSFNQGAKPVRFFGFGCDNSSYPAGIDLSETIVLTERGNCLTIDKATVARQFGARTVLIFNSDAAPVTPQASEIGVKAALINRADGLAIVAALKKGKVIMSFPKQNRTEIDNTIAGSKISSFSTYGPDYTLNQANPAVAAPGGNILSTFPVRYGSYAIISGTSMATPYVSGAIALFLSAKGNNLNNKALLPSILTTTSVPIANYSSASRLLESVVHQGGGLLNMSKAFTAGTVVSTQMIFLNDSLYFNGTQSFRLKNIGKKAATYTFDHVPAGTLNSLTPDAKAYYAWPVPLVANSASVVFGQSKLTLQPGKSATVRVNFTAPTGLNPKQQPIYSGFLRINSSLEAEPYQVPYFGLAARIYDQQVIYRAADLYNHTLPALTNGLTGKFQDNTATYNFSRTNVPVINFYLQSGTPFLAIDAVRANQTGLPANPSTKSKRSTPITFGERSNFGAMPMMGDGMLPRGLVDVETVAAAAQVAAPTDLLSALASDSPFSSSTLGHINGGVATYLPRSSGGAYAFAWDGSVINPDGVTVKDLPNGQYRLFIYALKISADASQKKNYETWLSPIITIKR